jgi:hypothetical protein
LVVATPGQRMRRAPSPRRVGRRSRRKQPGPPPSV